jgi:hypothetical protein
MPAPISATQTESDLAALLLGLERQLMDPAVRKNRELVSALLAEDFREFGSSGREWSRESILDLLASEPAQPAPVVEDFAIRVLSLGVVLVTYRTTRSSIIAGTPAQTNLRSSIWIRSPLGSQSAWQVLFHQGTKVPTA